QGRPAAADGRQMHPDAELGRVVEPADGLLERRAIGEHRGAGHDALAMREQHGARNLPRHPVVVGIDDEQPQHSLRMITDYRTPARGPQPGKSPKPAAENPIAPSVVQPTRWNGWRPASTTRPPGGRRPPTNTIGTFS